ncbi:MAG: hypothetical protein ABI469_02230 [Gemmatimonadales bacterium]
MTAEELMKLDPDMPRAVAEYQVKKMDEGIRDYDLLSREFARVSSADSLRALSTEEAAARWLEAKGWQWRNELAGREAKRHSGLACPDVPDSLQKKVDSLKKTFAAQAMPVVDVLGATSASGLLRYVVVGFRYKGGRVAAVDEADSWLGMSPRVMTLRSVDGTWKVIPTEDMPQSDGLGDTVFTFGCDVKLKGDSARKK